jgi:hypothetical protein
MVFEHGDWFPEGRLKPSVRLLLRNPARSRVGIVDVTNLFLVIRLKQSRFGIPDLGSAFSHRFSLSHTPHS